MNQEQIKDEKSSIFTLLLSSILLHILLMLAIIFYRLKPDVTAQIPKKLSKDDRVVLWTDPKPKAPTPPMQQQAKEEAKKSPIIPDPLNAPRIIPGKQGIDEQDIYGANAPQEKIKIEQKTGTIKETQTTEITQKDTPILKNSNYDLS